MVCIRLVLGLCAGLLACVEAHKWTASGRAFTRDQTGRALEEHLAVKAKGDGIRPAVEMDGPSAVAHFAVSPSVISDFGSITLTVVSFDNWVPMPDDYVTLSCGPQQNDDDFLDKVLLLDKTNIPITLTFTEMVFMRCDYKFTYVATSYDPVLQYFAIGSVTVPMADAPTTPKQVHLSYIGSPDTMVVQYVSSSTRTAPAAKYGTSPKTLNQRVRGVSTTYRADEMCGSPANHTAQAWFRDPGFIHTITLRGLQPDVAYFYQLGNDDDGWTDVFTFRSAPAGPRPTRFIAFGDQDVIEPSRNVSLAITEAAKHGLDFVLHFGDLGYAMGNHWKWDKWGTIMSWGASSVPYLVSPGNHEYDYHENHGKNTRPASSFCPAWWTNGPDASRGECGVPLEKRHTAPKSGDSVFYYSFVYGNVFVVQLSSEHDFTEGSAQWVWLKKQLASVDRAVTPWIVVTAHRPLYSTQECETGDFVVSLHMRRALDPLFDAFKVDLALVAHTHSYERTCPLKNGVCVQDGQGTVHITVGSAGAGLEGCGYSPHLGNFSRRHLNAWGYLSVDAGMNTLDVKMILAQNSSVFDYYVLKRRVLYEWIP